MGRTFSASASGLQEFLVREGAGIQGKRVYPEHLEELVILTLFTLFLSDSRRFLFVLRKG